MKHKSITDSNYPTIESLADADGSLNAAISKTDAFKTLKAYKKLIEATSELDMFERILPKHRFAFYTGKAKIEKCLKCGKPYIYFPQAQRRFALCRHKQITDKGKFKTALVEAKAAKMKTFVESLGDGRIYTDENQYLKTLAELAAKPANYAFIPTKDELSGFYHDLIIKTKSRLQVDPNDLDMPQRLYLELHGLDSPPACVYCGKPVPFVNRKTGYAKSCPGCARSLSNDTRSENNRKSIDENFNFSKYEILEYPKLLNGGKLKIRCRKCGKTSEKSLKNGMIGRLMDFPMCDHCERAREETEFAEFVRSTYNGKIVHGEGGRKTIPPYELDLYLPDAKLAFEYDGLYWHSDSVKPERSYHLNKTKMCDRKGIRLIHVFSNEWIFKRKIVESRIKDMLGMYGTKLYARKCETREVPSSDSRKFQEENHLQGAVNAKIHIGLYRENMLVALMTFGKCRFDKKTEWEMLRFCCKIGYHIPGAAGKLLSHFEKKYSPKSLVSYADLRWSQGGLYRKLGFELARKSPPNYWYFKKNDNSLLSRVNFQKHKLKDVLEKFDPSKSERENMKDNGYYRIYDCGNLVFVKEY